MKTEILTDALQDAVGDGLRTVATGDTDEESFDIVYMREDIGALYSENEREEILHDLVLENLVEVRQEGLFAPLGTSNLRVECSNTASTSSDGTRTPASSSATTRTRR
jgi:hypothetical protein